MAFSASETGILAYGVGVGTPAMQMTWLDRQGKPLSVVGPPGIYQGVDVAPDGMRVVAHRHEGQGGDLWLSELSRGTTSRFTFDASQNNSSAIWVPDGSRIVFSSFRDGKFGLYQKRSNEAGGEELLVDSNVTIVPTSVSPDGRITLRCLSQRPALSDSPICTERQPGAGVRADRGRAELEVGLNFEGRRERPSTGTRFPTNQRWMPLEFLSNASIATTPSSQQ